MAHTITVTGPKADALASMTQQAQAQMARQSGLQEREQLEDAVKRATDLVNQYAGDGDTVSISISGHISTSDTAIGLATNVGVSISKAAASPGAQAGSTAALDAARAQAASAHPSTVGGAPAPAPGALPTSNAPTTGATGQTATGTPGTTR